MSDADRQGGAGRREVAWRLFAAEYDDATLEYSEADEERAPNYVVTPTGARVNRLFVVGVLTEIESVTDDVLRARVVDPSGAFVVYAGQYQPDAVAFLEDAAPPAYVALTGKARTYQPDGSERIFTSVRPEAINAVDAETRDRWTVQTAAQTVERVATMAATLERDTRGESLTEDLIEAGVDYGLAAGIPLAIDHYGTTETYLAALRRVAIDAARVVAGEVDEVEPLAVAPDEGGAADAALAADVDLEPAVAGAPETETETTAGATGASPGVDDGSAEPAATDGEPADATPTTVPDAAASGEPEETAAVESPDAAPDADADDEDDADAEGAVEGEFELDDEERDRIEAFYGTEFSTGTEVDEPGAADIETPGDGEPEVPAVDADEPEADGEPEPAGEPSADPAGGVADDDATTGETAAETDPEDEETATAGADDPDADLDLEAAVVAAMHAADDGDGADREAVVEAVVADHDVDADAVEDAIQSALMSGKCYEPAEGRLKAI